MASSFNWSLTALAIGILLFLLPHGLPLADGVVLRLLARPAAAATDAARSSRSLIDLVRSIRTLRTENEQLKTENLRLTAELARLEEVEHENQVLRAELDLAAAHADRFDRIAATIIGRSPATFLQTVVIDQGERLGVAVGQAVLAQGFLVGRVAEVAATTAKIELITARRSLIPIVAAQSRATGLLRGGLAGLTVEDLPSDAEIQPGEVITTSPLGEIVPGDLPVGTVVSRLSSDSDIVERVSVHSPVEFNKLETVFVLRPKK